TNGSGSTAATSDPVSVTAGGCADGPHGVTINGGAIFTTSPGVTLTIHEPAGATSVTISNDGGFANSTTTAIACNDSYAWTLPSSGAERLPKVVYVRFGGSGLDPNQTFTDDIILDQTAPTTLAARVVEPLSVLKVRAHDRVSGVASLEVASKRGGKVTKLPYKHSQHLSRRL